MLPLSRAASRVKRKYHPFFLHRYIGVMVRKAFEGYDEPVNIDLDPEEALRIVLQVEPCDEDDEETP